MDLTTRQHVIYTLEFDKADGTPGTIEPGSVTVASSDPTIISVVLLPDGSVDVSSVAAGTGARFVVTADADLGAGVVPITGTNDGDLINVTADARDAATTVRITGGVPVDKP